MLAGCTSVEAPPAPASVPIPAAQVTLAVQRTPVDAGHIAWSELGSGPALVLLNGTASPMAEWDPALLAALASRHRVIVMDFPGLGGSSPLPGRLTFDALADTVQQWLTAIGVERPDVLGWSMGTFVAQRLAVRHPEAAASLLLVGGNPGGSATTLGPRWVQRADSDPNYTTRTYLRTNYPASTCAQSAGRAFLERQSAAVESGRFPPDRVPERTYDAMVAAEDPWLRSDRNLRQLATLDLPVSVLVGADDVITPPPNSREIADAIPGATLTEVTGAGHSLMFQDPDGSAALIDGLVRGEVTAGARRTVPGNCP